MTGNPKRQRISHTATPVRTPRRNRNAVSNYFDELERMKDTIDQTMVLGAEVDKYIHTVPESLSRPEPLTTIDFLSTTLEFRQIIYRYLLVTPAKTIRFSDQTVSSSVEAIRPQLLETSILYLNSQIYREASRILYGENKFIAAEPSHLFLPNGLPGLRRKTTTFIRHLSFEKKESSAQLSYETSDDIYQPIWKTLVDNPGFLGLRTLTIRRETFRPANIDLTALQMLATKHGPPVDTRTLCNKKEIVVAAAAKLAWKAASRGPIFQGLIYVEQGEQEVYTGEQTLVRNVIEVCLTTNRGDVFNISAGNNLHSALLDMLFQRRQAGIDGADQDHHFLLAEMVLS